MKHQRIGIPAILSLVFVVLICNNLLGQESEYPSEGALVHTCRDYYISGDVMHFRVFNFSSTDQLLPAGIACLILSKDNNPVKQEIIIGEKNIFSGSIYLHDTLSTGFYNITAFTNWMRNMDANLLFEKTIFIANRFDSNIIESLPGEFINYKTDPVISDISKENPDNQPIKIQIPEKLKKREKISFTLTTQENWNSSIAVAVSIVNMQSVTYENLSAKHAENYARKIKNTTIINPTYKIEANEFFYEGQLTINQTPAPGKNLILFAKNDYLNLLETQTDNKGNFHFMLPADYTAHEIYISLFPDDEKSDWKITEHDRFQEIKRLFNNDEKDHQQKIGVDINNILKLQKYATVRRAYFPKPLITIKNPSDSGLPKIYSAPYFHLNPSNYLAFNNLQIISREIIPPLRIRKDDNHYRSVIVGTSEKPFSSETGAFFIDGVYCNDLDLLIPLSSNDIERIEIQNFQWRYGNTDLDGIVGIFTRENQSKNIIEELNLHKVDFEPHTTGHSDENNQPYDSKIPDKNIPDLRQLLFWNPSVRINADSDLELEFQTGDIKGEYLLQIRGISSDGEVISQYQTFSVE